jgi:hypothetical protein
MFEALGIGHAIGRFGGIELDPKTIIPLAINLEVLQGVQLALTEDSSRQHKGRIM